MKKKLFLFITLATLVFSVSGLTFGANFNSYQTTSGVSKKQTDTDKKEAKKKREEAKMEAKKEADQKRLDAKKAKKTSTKKKHKKFLGIF